MINCTSKLYALPWRNSGLIVLTRKQLILIHILALLSLSTFLAFYNLDSGSTWGTKTAVDESRHIRVAQEMWLTGKWWMPTLGGEHYFLKPPFKMWLTWIPTHLMGESNFSYRFLDGLLCQGIVIILYFFTLELFKSTGAAFFTCLFLLGNHLFFFNHGVRSAVQDTMMLFLTSLAMLFLWKIFKNNVVTFSRNQQIRWGLIIGLLIGLAAMSKSIVAYYPFGIICCYLLFDHAALAKAKRNHYLWGTAVFISVVIPALYVIPHAIFTADFYKGAIDHEIIGRFNIGFHNSDRPDYYFRLLEKGLVVPPLPLLLGAIFFFLVGSLRSKPEYRFVLIWAALPFLLFSYLPSRLEWYLSPAYLPFAMIVGLVTAEAGKKSTAFLENIFDKPRWLTVFDTIPIVLFIFFCFTTFQGVSLINKIRERVIIPVPRLEVDYLSEEIINNLASKQKGEILVYDTPPSSTMENVYFNMMEPYVSKGGSLDILKERFNLIQPSFVLTSITQAKDVIAATNPTSYSILPACHIDQGYNGVKRLEPIVALSYLSTGKFKLFHPLNNLITFSESIRERLLYGWDYEHSMSEHMGIIRGLEAALAFHGDALLYHLGAHIVVNLASVQNSGFNNPEVEFAINSFVVSRNRKLSNKHEDYEFAVPPQVIRKGNNVLRFTLRYSENEQITNKQKTAIVKSISVQIPR